MGNGCQPATWLDGRADWTTMQALHRASGKRLSEIRQRTMDPHKAKELATTLSDNLAGVLHNDILLTVICAWLAAQVIKAAIEFRFKRRITWRVLFGMGGMPSSHSASVTSLSTAVGLHVGFDSALFAVAAILAAIVMTDAAGVRRAAGRHASILNWLLSDFTDEEQADEKDADEDQAPAPEMNIPLPLQELLGHTPAQVVVGGLLGILTAIVYYAVVK